MLIQFSRPIDAAILAGVRRAGGTSLRYVPDNAISAAVTGTFDPYSIAGAVWMGELEPIDRVSAETARDLGNAFLSHPLTVIEFHPDVERSTIARVRWSKAGVMLRASGASGSAHPMALVSRSRGIAFQRRQELNGVSVHSEGGAGAAPAWLWLSRRGHRIEAYTAPDGGDWRLIDADTIDLGSDVLAVTNHDVPAWRRPSFRTSRS